MTNFTIYFYKLIRMRIFWVPKVITVYIHTNVLCF